MCFKILLFLYRMVFLIGCYLVSRIFVCIYYNEVWIGYCICLIWYEIIFDLVNVVVMNVEVNCERVVWD